MYMQAHTHRDTETPQVPPRIFYINLDKSTDRRAHMEMALLGFPGHVERVPAVSASEVNRPPFFNYMRVNGLDSHLRSKTKAVQAKTASCWLSHVLLWERLQSELEPQDTAFIMEDDVQFPENWTQALPETMRDAPDGWDALKVCGWGYYRQADVVDDNWAVPRWPFYENGRMLYAGSCGYIVSGSGLPRLLKRVLGQEIKDIDVAMMLPEEGTVATTGLAIYEQRPGRRLLWTGGFGSTIREWGEQYSDYDPFTTDTDKSGCSMNMGRVCRDESTDETLTGEGTARISIHSWNQCKLLCEEDPGCAAFEFKTSESRCEFHTSPTTKAVLIRKLPSDDADLDFTCCVKDCLSQHRLL
ncbi:unnamed protein product [Polarella glacialis]|uniref:Apple domain-containing protein n=1 Tax=Polarella glacialis TaxID=89957 RepID=A0A813EEQ7_POLGL|nr:unnamed protein product [Polarella glacialis]CAE8596548.1 unnamed protein product [Polarella glacialis]CAE8696934.1 unnamed protein product [Polarella glacialis]